ncbi:MAG: DMT family transporter [Erysipelotrichaceae bacterium]|nr:DMT family transporter [Erysipelotrichaceae bacterium]MBQ1483157.1 DMT family transporter [Erysipelotrichaceae bacterium]
MSNKKFFASFMLLLATLFWGLSYTVQSISASGLGPFTTVFFKGAGGFFLLPLLAGKKKIDRETLTGGLLMGAFAFGGCLLQQLGIMYSTVSKASFITALYIIFVPLIEIFFGRKVRRSIWFSCLLAVAGLYFLCMNSVAGINIGDLFLLLGSVLFAGQIIVIDRCVRKCDPVALTFISQSAVALFALAVSLIREKPDVSSFAEMIPAIFYIVFIGGLISQLIQIRYQRDLEPSLASLLMSFESVFGALFGWLILHQVMSPKEIFGCLLVFIAILLAETK